MILIKGGLITQISLILIEKDLFLNVCGDCGRFKTSYNQANLSFIVY